jgi:hypothetical protein
VRRPLALALALLLTALIAAPAQAATVHRTFVAKVGTDGKNGTAQIEAFTDGSGRRTYALKGLKDNATYRVRVFKGTCSKNGDRVVKLGRVTTSSTGTVSRVIGLSITRMNKIWTANYKHRLSIRFISGSSVRCGNLNFTRATRVWIPKQDVLDRGINLPVVRSPKGYPYCDVAMYLGALNQPTEPGVTYLFAHARKGMFLPLLDEWLKNRGADMIGLKVYVYTSDNMRYTYVVDKVWKSKTVDGVYTSNEQLWLQTSTGPNYTYPKLFLRAKRTDAVSVSWSAAHPTPHVVKCG